MRTAQRQQCLASRDRDTMSDEENAAVPICSLPHCDEPTDSAVCTGTTPHYLCDSCFCGYASSQFDAMGAFTNERASTEFNVVSSPGELPCYLFLTNECDCGSIPATTLARVLSTDPIALDAYESAKRRLIQAENDKEKGAPQRKHTPVEKLRQVVVDALSRGGYVPCPSCGQHGQKNDACMHMRCPCGTRYCYCCGRPRGDTPGMHCRSDGSGCDYPSPYLESHPDWNSYSVSEEESAGMGALHEFHRRRMAYFLRQVKVNYTAELWEQLRREHPNLLDSVPTEARCISWDEIDGAEPPLFGSTTVEELAWQDGGVSACADGVVEEQQQPKTRVRSSRHRRARRRADHPPACEASRSFLVLWMIGFILSIMLLCLRVTSDSQGLRTFGNILIVLLCGTGLPILAMYITDYYAINPQQACIREVQCFRGRRDDLPYLASQGRWYRRRRVYWFTFFFGIALASICIAAGNRNRQVVHAFGIFLLTDILVCYSGITMLVNTVEPPLLEPRRTQFCHFMLRVCGHVTVTSIGIGVIVIFGNYGNGNVVGKVLFALGFAGVVAELTPRAIEFWRAEEPFADTPNTLHLIASYLFWEGMTVGSLMIDFSSSSAIKVAGISVLVCSLLIPSVALIHHIRQHENE